MRSRSKKIVGVLIALAIPVAAFAATNVTPTLLTSSSDNLTLADTNWNGGDTVVMLFCPGLGNCLPSSYVQGYFSNSDGVDETHTLQEWVDSQVAPTVAPPGIYKVVEWSLAGEAVWIAAHPGDPVPCDDPSLTYADCLSAPFLLGTGADVVYSPPSPPPPGFSVVGSSTAVTFLSGLTAAVHNTGSTLWSLAMVGIGIPLAFFVLKAVSDLFPGQFGSTEIEDRTPIDIQDYNKPIRRRRS